MFFVLIIVLVNNNHTESNHPQNEQLEENEGRFCIKILCIVNMSSYRDLWFLIADFWAQFESLLRSLLKL